MSDNVLSHIDVSQAFQPLHTIAYLRARGWSKSHERPGKYELWTKSRDGTEFEALVPLAQDASDLKWRVAELVETLQKEERRDPEDVWENLSSPYSDIVQARLIGNGDTTLPLEDGSAAFQFARDLMLAAASAAWKPKAVYGPRKPDQAIDFVRKARLGQTRPGSYIIKVIAPLDVSPQTPDLFGEHDTPFPRLATTTLATALASVLAGVRESVETGRVEGMSKLIPRGVSANLCDALAGLGRIGRGVQVSFSWAPAHPQYAEVKNQYMLSSDAAVHLEKTSRWFRQTATLEDVEFFGSVLRLARVDEETDDVSMIGTVDGEKKSVRVYVEDKEREILTKAHHDRAMITCVGELSKDGKFYRLENMRDLTVVEEPAAEVDDVPVSSTDNSAS